MTDFSDKELETRNLFFKQLSLSQFKKPIKLSNRETFPKATQIITTEQDAPELRLIISGSVKIRQKGKILSTLHAGSFIGEISFMSGSQASADVSSTEETNVISWDQTILRKLLLANPCLHLIFTQIVNSGLAQKLSSEQ